MPLRSLRRVVPASMRRPLRRAIERRSSLWARLGRGGTNETDLTYDDVAPSALEHLRPPELRGRPIGFGSVRTLSIEPPVFMCGMPYDQYQGFAPAFGKRYGQRPAGFLIVPTWSIEYPDRADAIAAGHRWHRQAYPDHQLRYLCNSPGEADLLQERGLPALLLNHKLTVSDEIFRPLPDVPVEFDAVYNARFVVEKRHELAALIPSVAYLAYVEGQSSRQREFRRLRSQVLAAGAGHVLVNDLADGLPVRMPAEGVNRVLNRAAVGLLLSELEGASYAAVEYLLAGLPIVSTPSRGGREAYFDPEFCLIAEPTPEAVRDATAELVARQIPRDHIRAVTLDKVRVQRQRLMEQLGDLVNGLGGEPPPADAWPYGDISGVPWATFNRHLADFEAEQKTALAADVGLEPAALEGVQLSAHELMTVITEIGRRPGGSLLVFGVGHDSALWEHVNASGMTAFVESDPRWAQQAQSRLTRSSVHLTSYTTRVERWRELLDRPADLNLSLPPEVRSRQWDVIVVDGPPGYSRGQPGRMSSIYEASRLVAPGGRVFVHDVEREPEAAFASRYLGDRNCVVEVTGRATLRGYAR